MHRGNPSGKNNRDRGTSVRAFVQANRTSAKTKVRSSPIFHDEIRSDDLPESVVKAVRKSGVLNLSNKRLINVPSKVWRINDLDENEKSAVSVSLDNPSPEKWWEFVDLAKLIIANNYITEIPKDVGQLLTLQTLDAHDNQLEEIPDEIGCLEYLQKLDVSRNKIKSLPDGVYKLKRLGDCNFSHNSIETISEDLGNLNCLRTLDISNNKLTTLPEELCLLSLLTNLNLSKNRLTNLPSELGSLTGLRILDASENCITSVPSGVSDLIRLEILYLQRNQLAYLPNIVNCKNLKEIYLQNNILREFNSEVFALTKVQMIDLRCNKVEGLHIENDDLEFLERFYVENNDIGDLPPGLANLPSLKALTLDGNPLRGIRLDILQRGSLELLKFLRERFRIKEGDSCTTGTSPRSGKSRTGFGECDVQRGTSNKEELEIDEHKIKATKVLHIVSQKIKYFDNDVFDMAAAAQVNNVDLSKNALISLPQSFEHVCEYLTELKLDNNFLTSLPGCIGSSCVRLYFLSFQSNQIEELSAEFENLKTLREINLAHNKFKAIPTCVYHWPKLEILIAAGNKIEYLEPDGLMKLKSLGALDVRNNNIAKLPPELGLMTQLRSLNVEGNAFRAPNYQVISQGTDAILRYLQHRIKE